MIKQPSSGQLHLLAELFAGRKDAADSLRTEGGADLLCVFDYLAEEKEEAFLALKASGSAVLAAFCKAVDGERSSVKFLLQTGNPQWAAASNFINGDEKAMVWLEKNGYTAHAMLARKIAERFRKENDENPFHSIFNSPI
ncbi:MAG: hypothetical protein IT233_09885 [Bacteroidia bacterium]|nr:hypothetical protein [Bacteroidia bacterium]